MFLFKESYKHRSAIDILTKWLRYKYVVKQEVIFNGFVPDITVYENNKIKAIYEVTHKHDLDGKKLHEMQKFAYYNNIHFPIYEVEAEWILNRCRKPKIIQCTTFQI